MADEPSQETSELLTETRETFTKEILKFYTIKSGRNLYEWRTREWIENKIKEILEEIQDVGEIAKYYVQEINGIKVLKIAKDSRGGNLQIVPMEDYFDIIYAAHMFTAHGTYEKVNNHLKYKKLFVPRMPILYFLRNCEVCITIEFEKRIKSGKYHAFLELIELSDTPDPDKRFVMHYKVLNSKHAFLCLLSSTNEAEVAEQLLELFNQIGPPSILHTESKSFTDTIIHKMSILYPKNKIISGKELKFEEAAKDIKDNLKTWIARNRSMEYSKGMYYYSSPESLELDETKQNMLSASQPGPSFTNQEKTSDIQGHKSIYHEKVLQLIKKRINTRRPPAPPPVQAKVYKTYAKKKTQHFQTKTLNDSKDEPPSKKAVCVDSNIKEIAKGFYKSKKRMYDIWNSITDLPDQNSSNEKNIIEVTKYGTSNFGTMPKASSGILDDFNVSDEIRHINDPDQNLRDPLEIVCVKKEYSETDTYLNTLEINVKHEEETDVTNNFCDEKPSIENVIRFGDVNNTDIKEETFETSTFNDLSSVDLKNNIKDEQSFGIIVKVESVTE